MSKFKNGMDIIRPDSFLVKIVSTTVSGISYWRDKKTCLYKLVILIAQNMFVMWNECISYFEVFYIFSCCVMCYKFIYA